MLLLLLVLSASSRHYTHTHVCMYTRVHKHTYLHVHTIYVHHPHSHIYMHALIHMHMCTYMCVHMACSPPPGGRMAQSNRKLQHCDSCLDFQPRRRWGSGPSPPTSLVTQKGTTLRLQGKASTRVSCWIWHWALHILLSSVK